MKRVAFEASAFEDFVGWAANDKKTYAKIVALIRDIQRSAFTGLGKPKPLKHDLKGYWSRRSWGASPGLQGDQRCHHRGFVQVSLRIVVI